jgi:type I restriction enzyme M protein
MANGSLSSQQSSEGEIRKALIEADLVDCIVALPAQLFYSTQIPVCLWFLAKDRSAAGGFRDRRGEVLFIDARSVGQLVTRVYRVLTDQEVGRIATTYHAWRGEPEAGDYSNVPAYCKSASLGEIAESKHVLSPGRYVGADRGDVGDPVHRVDELRHALLRELESSAQLADLVRTTLARLDV